MLLSVEVSGYDWYCPYDVRSNVDEQDRGYYSEMESLCGDLSINRYSLLVRYVGSIKIWF